MDNRKRNYPKLHRPLAWLVVATAVLTVVSIGGLMFDDRVIVGASAWAKPLKFSLSIGIYAATLAVLIPLMRRGQRIARGAGTVIAIGTIVELLLIVGQVLRGQGSHFNTATAFNATVFGLMGVTILVVWSMTLLIGFWLWRQEIGDKSVTLAVRWGVVIAVIGMALAFLMTMPQAGQIEAGGDIIGTHSVDAADDGPGLPLLGWSTVGGDLRVPHFVGMHALQVMPLLALGLSSWGRRGGPLRDETTRSGLIAIAAFGYAGLTALVTWQALNGEPVIAPGRVTLTAGVVLLVTLVVAVWRVLVLGSRRRDTADGQRPQDRVPSGR